MPDWKAKYKELQESKSPIKIVVGVILIINHTTNTWLLVNFCWTRTTRF